MGKKKEFETPAAESNDPTPPPKRMTQREAVTRAIAAGRDQPSDGVAYIREMFDLELTNQSFSTLKSQIKKASGLKKLTAHTYSSSNGSRRGGGPLDSMTVELARDVKHLVARYGADAVKQMVDVFAD